MSNVTAVAAAPTTAKLLLHATVIFPAVAFVIDLPVASVSVNCEVVAAAIVKSVIVAPVLMAFPHVVVPAVVTAHVVAAAAVAQTAEEESIVMTFPPTKSAARSNVKVSAVGVEAAA